MKNNREVVITYEQVREYIKNNMKHSIDSIVDAVEPFSMEYIKSPFGFAETDDYNDIVKLVEEIQQSFYFISLEDGRSRKGIISRNIKQEQQRWKEGNAGFFGRHIGRLAYLLNKQQQNLTI